MTNRIQRFSNHYSTSGANYQSADLTRKTLRLLDNNRAQFSRFVECVRVISFSRLYKTRPDTVTSLEYPILRSIKRTLVCLHEEMVKEVETFN